MMRSMDTEMSPFTRRNMEATSATSTSGSDSPESIVGGSGRPAATGRKVERMRTDRPVTRRTEVVRPAGAPAGDRPTPTEAWLLALGLEAEEVERCPEPTCEVCIGAMPEAA